MQGREGRRWLNERQEGMKSNDRAMETLLKWMSDGSQPIQGPVGGKEEEKREDDVQEEGEGKVLRL